MREPGASVEIVSSQLAPELSLNDLILFWDWVLICSPGQPQIHHPPASDLGISGVCGTPGSA